MFIVVVQWGGGDQSISDCEQNLPDQEWVQLMNNKKLYVVILAMTTPCSLKRIHEFKKKPKFHTGSIWGSEISKSKVRWKISQNYEALISKVSQSC